MNQHQKSLVPAKPMLLFSGSDNSESEHKKIIEILSYYDSKIYAFEWQFSKLLSLHYPVQIENFKLASKQAT